MCVENMTALKSRDGSCTKLLGEANVTKFSLVGQEIILGGTLFLQARGTLRLACVASAAMTTLFMGLHAEVIFFRHVNLRCTNNLDILFDLLLWLDCGLQMAQVDAQFDL